ncbi:putative [histone H3]-lysine(4) N-trimethyltransferase [Helianthus annuus]|nr:putative [histone H3]-lysine(4) N-trimethyltransferase [Helianthus annuus]KAJ0563678.1 putative [histone H3]-lysine(4) N-trimethyltransferase [Helianthus annuus]KAJ0729010.1 putative [histone H3]-lysine(4) N-trimethyltransferase [Helianthus annuus]KAJ0731764.1 putative [histone H3]-lysine(4) N-trimethyltransferase [Helianthus annuus]KAJ0908601.1 putative [histone H3]-lysine(4) N-trimethyltransferase [Helianthus annuus]
MIKIGRRQVGSKSWKIWRGNRRDVQYRKRAFGFWMRSKWDLLQILIMNISIIRRCTMMVNLWDPENNEYCCPECKGQFSFDQSVVDESQSKVSSCTESNDQSTLPDKIVVVCTDIEGIYYPKLHLIQCKCGSCGIRKQTPSELVRHTGSRPKKLILRLIHVPSLRLSSLPILSDHWILRHSPWRISNLEVVF